MSPSPALQVAFYSSTNLTSFSVLSRFKKAVYGAKFRQDGKLMAVGGEEGRVRVFDASDGAAANRAPLRFFKAHSRYGIRRSFYSIR